MQCSKFTIALLGPQKEEVCIWSNGECFGQVDILDTLFDCKGELMERASSDYYDLNQVWIDVHNTKFALFPVLNEIAQSIQNRNLGHFTSLSLSSMKTANFAEVIPENNDLKLLKKIIESKVTIDVKKRVVQSPDRGNEKKAKFTLPSPRPILNISTDKSTSPIRRAGNQTEYALPSPSASTPSPALLNKHQFLSMFEIFYERMEESGKLNALLKDQTRKSALLLQTLQGSGQMIEGLVRAQVNEVHTAYTGRAIQELSNRIAVIEERLGIEMSNDQALEARLDTLEKHM